MILKMLLFLRRIILFFQRHALWFIVLFLGTAASFFVFREWYYFGTLHLYFSEEQTTVVIGNSVYPCEQNFCSFKLIPGEYDIRIEKKGFRSDEYSAVIGLRQTTEYTSVLQQNEASFQSVLPKNIYYSGITFPLDQSQVFSTVPFVSVQENILRYKNSDVVPLSQPVFVSTDEVGRRAWVVSETLVSEFIFSEKTYHPVLQNDIQTFVPLGNNSFAFKNNVEQWFLFDSGDILELNFTPYSEKTFCSFREDTFVFLQYDEGMAGVFFYDTDSEAVEKVNTLENFTLNNEVFLKCSSDTVFVTVDENTAFTLSW